MSNSDQQYAQMRERVVQDVAADLGMPADEVRNAVDTVLGPAPLVDTPWEQIRKTPKPPKNLAWRATLQWYRDNAHEVYVAPNGWRWYVLKSYQQSRTQQYARAFCLVDGFESELGDVYWSEILANASRTK